MRDETGFRSQDTYGSRWALVGAVVYLLEWVGIIAAGAAGLGNVVVRDTPAADLVDSYADHPDAASFLAGWLAVTLLGRVLLFIGVRDAFARSGTRHPLLDLAVVAAAVSVTLEIASYGLGLGAIRAAEDGDESLVSAIDAAGAGLNLMIGGGLGVAILCATYCMWRSGQFATVLNVLGAVSGVAIVGAQLSVAPSTETLFDILFFFPLVFWVWMLWAGVVLWRRASRA